MAQFAVVCGQLQEQTHSLSKSAGSLINCAVLGHTAIMVMHLCLLVLVATLLGLGCSCEERLFHVYAHRVAYPLRINALVPKSASAR